MAARPTRILPLGISGPDAACLNDTLDRLEAFPVVKSVECDMSASPVADLMYLSLWNELAMADLLAAPPPPHAREPAHTEHAVLLSDRPESP